MNVHHRHLKKTHNKIPFKLLDVVIALNQFDSDLKSLFYPKIMFIENALKSYTIERQCCRMQSQRI
ncbi:MAG: Abi family protein [Catenibacterium sp.]|nr:Abi family protein [Catenibacterium sp.]